MSKNMKELVAPEKIQVHKIPGTQNSWSLLTGGRCSELALRYKKLKMGPQNSVHCRLVVVIRRWSLTQV